MPVDGGELILQPHGVRGQRDDVRHSLHVGGGVVQTRGGHVSASDRLDLLQLKELLFADYLRENTDVLRKF